jgi:putative phosphoesterase
MLRPEVSRVFEGVSLILHAGDVGGAGVLEGLARIARVEAVFGNVDDPADPRLAPERLTAIDGVTIHVSHGHELGRPTAQLVLARYACDVAIFGHTHKAVLFKNRDGRTVLNPGAAGPRRFDLRPSVARLTIVAGRADAEIISLA